MFPVNREIQPINVKLLSLGVIKYTQYGNYLVAHKRKLQLTKKAAPNTPALSPRDGLTMGVSSLLLKTYLRTESNPRSYNKSMLPTPPPITITSGSIILIMTLNPFPKNSIKRNIVFCAVGSTLDSANATISLRGFLFPVSLK